MRRYLFSTLFFHFLIKSEQSKKKYTTNVVQIAPIHSDNCEWLRAMSSICNNKNRGTVWTLKGARARAMHDDYRKITRRKLKKKLKTTNQHPTRIACMWSHDWHRRCDPLKHFTIASYFQFSMWNWHAALVQLGRASSARKKNRTLSVCQFDHFCPVGFLCDHFSRFFFRTVSCQ